MDCSWDNPGINPFTGNVRQAIISYGFPESEVEKLVYRIKRSDFDTVVFITKDGINSFFGTSSNLRDMHWGKNEKCSGSVKRTKWSEGRQERASVYCSDFGCVAIPKICGNISRIDYFPKQKPEVLIRPETVINHVPEPNSLWLVAICLIPLLIKNVSGISALNFKVPQLRL